MKILAAMFFLLVSAKVEAKGLVTIEPIGAHYPIFVVEKNENPQNFLVAYTKLNSKCEIEVDPQSKAPVLDYYWMMDRKSYKPVHRMIKGGIRDRLAGGASLGADGKSFQIHVNDLKELQQDLESPVLTVTSSSVAGKVGECDVRGEITLGPSDKRAHLRLDSIYTESKTTFLPPFRKVVAVTLIGVNVETPKLPLRRKYSAK